MKKNKYEISIWKDVHVNAIRDNGGNVTTPSHFEEQKLIIIGSSNMTSQARALEPKLVENINGTSTLTFKMFYKYIDNETGEKIDNPYIKLLVNERKVKCFWKDKWYNLVVKGIQEDSSGKSITYTCKDQFINELSKTGFDLEFSNELMNNSGTIKELAERVVEGTDWKIASSDTVLQELEEPVYEAKNNKEFTALDQKEGNVTIPANSKILIYYSVLTEKKPYFQFYYSGGSFTTESATSMLVNNGQCYGVESVSYGEIEDGSITITINKTGVVFTGVGEVSENYRAKRLVKQQKSEYVGIVGKYCSIYQDKNKNLYYGYEKTVLNDPTTIISTVANSGTNGFTSNEGWTLHEDEEVLAMPFGHYPLLDEESVSENNYPNSFLCLPQKGTTVVTATGSEGVTKQYIDTHPYTYLNKGISLNSSYYEKGFTKGEIYIFRIKTALGRNTPYLYYAGEGTSTNTVTYYYYDLETGSYKKAEGSVKGYYRYDDKKIHYYQGDVSVTQHDSAGKEYKRYFFHPVIGSYTTNKGYYDIEEYFEIVDNKTEFTEDGWLEYKMECTKSISQKDLSSNFGLFLRVYRSGWIQEVQFFKEIKDDSENPKRLEPNTINSEGVVQAQYYLFSSAEIANKTEEEEIEYAWRGDSQSEVPTDYSPVYPDNSFEKIRSIEAKQSNRFNILQTLAETFECYPIFTITNESTGNLKYENGIPEKTITFKQNYGQEVGFGFVYGIDLKTISRTIDSDQIVTKTIVSQNSNSAGLNGFCTIARASENETKASYILNLDYYINQGLIKSGILNNDLYNSATAIGLYPKLREQNNLYDGYSEKLSGKETTLTRLERMLESYEGGYQSALETITEKVTEFKSYAGKTCSYQEAYNKVNSGELKSNSNAVECVSAWTNALALRDAYSAQVESTKNVISELKSTIKDLKSGQEDCKTAIKNVEQEFFLKYSTFIQEGSWISEDYMDDNLYYLDAKSVAYTSSRPQIQYNISVLRLSALEEFKGKEFKLGDITYIEDTEFFGYKEISTDTGIFKVPYQELVTISEITSYFDTPENDSFKVQNYKTQFEDLFQRITATTQSLQYAEGEYKKAADAIDENGNIKATLLSQSLATNQNIMINYSNNQIVQDSTGITLWKKNDPQAQVKITAGGIIFTNNGGETWNTGIDASGVRSDALTAGAINSEKIMIYNGSYPSFRWTSSGIEAFSFSEAGVDFTTVVRFDQYGIYGIKDSSTTTGEPWTPKNEDDIWNSANFGLTWKGFFLKKAGDSHRFEISNENDLRIVKLNEGGEQEFVKIGCLNKGAYKQFTGESFVSGVSYYEQVEEEYVVTKDTEPSSGKTYYIFDLAEEVYGLRLTDNSGNITMETTSIGELWLRNKLHIQPSRNTYVQIGNLGDDQVFNANGDFIVYDNGSVLANNGTFNGVINAKSGSFTGTIYANEGMIGNTKISDDGNLIVKNAGLSIIAGVYNEVTTDEDVFSDEFIYYEKDGNNYILTKDNSPQPEKQYYIFQQDSVLLEYDIDNKTLNVSNGHFTGTIIAKDGEFTGKIDAKKGIIGGFIIGENQLSSKKETIKLISDGYVETEDTTIDPQKTYYVINNNKYDAFTGESFVEETVYYEYVDGKIIAENIELGIGATVQNYIKLGNAYIYNPKINDGRFIEASDNISLNQDGTGKFGSISIKISEGNYLTSIGNITLDGKNSTITGGDSFTISPDRSVFNNVDITGTLHTAVFEVGKVQTVGGAMLFREGAEIDEIKKDEDKIYFTTKTDVNWDKNFLVLFDNPGSLDKDGYPVEGYYGKIEEIREVEKKTRYYFSTNREEEKLQDRKIVTFLGVKQDDGIIKQNLLIGVNSQQNESNFLTPSSISFKELTAFNDNDYSVDISKPKLLLGELSSVGLDGWGLYGDNVYLKGSITTETGTKIYYEETKDKDFDNKKLYYVLVDGNYIKTENTSFEEGIIYYEEKTINSFSGINTLHDIGSTIFPLGNNIKNRIVFWAGAGDLSDGEIQTAPFQVTEDGSLYASKGVFEGSLLTKATIKGAKLYAGEIHGDENKGGALSIYNTKATLENNDFSSGGIFFKEEPKDEDEITTLALTDQGFYVFNKGVPEHFINFEYENSDKAVSVSADLNYLKTNAIEIGDALSVAYSVESLNQIIFSSGIKITSYPTKDTILIEDDQVVSYQDLIGVQDFYLGAEDKSTAIHYQKVLEDGSLIGYNVYIQ